MISKSMCDETDADCENKMITAECHPEDAKCEAGKTLIGEMVSKYRGMNLANADAFYRTKEEAMANCIKNVFCVAIGNACQTTTTTPQILCSESQHPMNLLKAKWHVTSVWYMMSEPSSGGSKTLDFHPGASLPSGEKPFLGLNPNKD